MCFLFALHFQLEQGHVSHKVYNFTMKLGGGVRPWKFVRDCFMNSPVWIQAISTVQFK